MLNSASDYEYLDMTGLDDVIHGDIIPIINPNSGDGGTPMLWEDVLYLKEAHLERSYISQEGQNTFSVGDNLLNGVAVQNLQPIAYNQSNPLSASGLHKPYVMARSFAGEYIQYINPDFTWNTNHIEYIPDSGGGFSRYLLEDLDDWGIYSPPAKEPYYSMRPLSRLPLTQIEYMRGLHYIWNKMTRAELNINARDIFSSITFYTYDKDGNVTSRTESPVSYYPDIIWSYTYQTYPQGVQQWFKNRDVSIQTKTLHYSNAKDFTLFFAIEIQSRISPYGKKGYWIPIKCNIRNGDVTLPSGFVDACIDRACQASGYARDRSSVQMRAGYAIIDFDFPAHFDNWGWQPSYS